MDEGRGPDIFQRIFRGKTVIVGIGNVMKGDDGLGPALIGNLKDKVKFTCIDGGTTPENYVRKISAEKPDNILLVDAVHLGLAPGEYRILSPEEIAKSGLTTHDISARMFMEYLRNETNAVLYMLAVQPENVSLGAAMSEPVKKALEEVEKLIKDRDNA
jgi:hydrogenase 3 maturation protease